MSSVLRKTRGRPPRRLGEPGAMARRPAPRTPRGKRATRGNDGTSRPRNSTRPGGGEPAERLERRRAPRRASCSSRRSRRARRRRRSAGGARGAGRASRSPAGSSVRATRRSDVAVAGLVEVAVLAADVEIVVAAQPVRLMDLEVEADRDHGAGPFSHQFAIHGEAAPRRFPPREPPTSARPRDESASRSGGKSEDGQDLRGEVLDVSEVGRAARCGRLRRRRRPSTRWPAFRAAGPRGPSGRTAPTRRAGRRRRLARRAGRARPAAGTR